MIKKIIIYAVATLIFSLILALSVYLYMEHEHHHDQDDNDLAEHEEHHHHHAHEHNDHEEGHDHHHGHHHHHHHDENAPIALNWTDEQIKELGIEIRPASSGELETRISATGRILIHPNRLAHVLAKVPGVAVDIQKNLGDFVRASENLAVLESREMAEAKASYLSALSRYQLASSVLNQEKRLYEKRISAKQDYLNAKGAYEESLINTQLAKQKLYALGVSDHEIQVLPYQKESQLRFYTIQAPIDGVILERHLTKGELVNDEETIFKIADLRTLWVEMGACCREMDQLRAGQSVLITHPSTGQQALARLVYISPIFDEQTILKKVIAELDNPVGEWHPGSIVNIKIATGHELVPILIPKEAIQVIENKSHVFVWNQGKLEKREVKTGRESDQVIEIIAGLDPRELYVVNKTFLIKADLHKGLIEHEH